MDSVLKALRETAKAFLEAKKNRQFLTEMAEGAFDRYIEPVNLPGPDAVIDPILRKGIKPLVTIMCDGLVDWLEELGDE